MILKKKGIGTWPGANFLFIKEFPFARRYIDACFYDSGKKEEMLISGVAGKRPRIMNSLRNYIF